MGLDQYAWAIKPEHLNSEKTVGFEMPDILIDAPYPECFREDPIFGSLFRTKLSGSMALAYWRKHPNLHGLIQELVARRPEWNEEEHTHWGSLCVPVSLTLEDIREIQRRTEKSDLPHTEGFFFGSSTQGDDALTLAFCDRAREAL